MFSVSHIACNVFGYQLSYLEGIAVLLSLICIWLAAREKVLNFAFGIACTALYMVFFYQMGLYSSMTLNAVFFAFNVYGYFLWTHPKHEEENAQHQLKVSRISLKLWIFLIIIICIGTVGWGYLVKHLHEVLPNVFEQATRYPFIDAFIMMASIVAQYCMVRKKIENWLMWIVVDAICVALYIAAGCAFTALLYALLVLIACKGLYDWRKGYIQQVDENN